MTSVQSWEKASQTEVAAIRPKASVRSVRAAVLELCAVGPTSCFSTFAEDTRVLPVSWAGLLVAVFRKYWPAVQK